MRTIIWFAFFWLSTFYTLLFIPKAKGLIKKGLVAEKRSYINRVASGWAKSLISLTSSSFEIIGLENIPKDQTVLFASNHQGNFDIPILLTHIPIPISFVAKKELMKLPMVSTWMKLMECVFIDRKDLRQSLRAISEAIEILKSGHSMVIFPEGTRSKGMEMQPFKPGSLKLASRASVPIIPVTIIGSYKILEANNNRVKPAKVKVIFSPALETGDVEKSTDLTVLVQDIIKENLVKYIK